MDNIPDKVKATETKINMLYSFIFRNGCNVPLYSDCIASEPHYIKSLRLEFHHENKFYHIKFEMIGGSHTVSITAKTYDNGKSIEETIRDVYSKDVVDFKNEYLSKITDLILELLTAGKLKNRL